MIRYRRYENSPDCFELIYLDPQSVKEKREHVHVSEIRRFFGHGPNETVIYSDSQLIEFFIYKCELIGTKGDYFQKAARKRARLQSTRRVGKPNSPGEGVE